VVASIGLLVCSAQRVAAATTLQDLITSGGTIVSGDKTFSNFMYASTGSMPSASLVTVVPVTINGNFGIEFQGGFNGTSAMSPSDALIKYTVTSSGAPITGAIMQGNPNVKGSNPNGTLSVTETFLPQQTNTKLQIFDIEPGSDLKNSDSVTFANSVQSLNVQKDILASVPALNPDGSPNNSIADISFIDQLFPQGGNHSTPEPASLTLLGIGALGLLGYRRFRS